MSPSQSCAENQEESNLGWGRGQWFVVLLLVALAVLLRVPSCGRVAEKAYVMQAVNNCRQIIISLKGYASDHEGRYPAGATANDALRELIKEKELEDERVFTAPDSPYVPDGIMGVAPDFLQALQSRENHWAMTKGLTVDTDGKCPLVFENPAVCSWPPLWLGGNHTAVPGRTFQSKRFPMANMIAVGCNDCSVNGERLKDGNGMVTLMPFPDGKNRFEQAGPNEILDVVK